ncbi:hypothetical protein HPG69_008697 [Diceros bicornis minor]|uniref:Uncharacterized protein n=1 Tax=Diceros bicornis minor TaxID=77932 RepID=A0A7J7FAK6_DICBM|nr:hypothetical protein HPG69_008697 [Diceros bicornis minor]
MVTGSLPFIGQNFRELGQQILRGICQISFYMSRLKPYIELFPDCKDSQQTGLMLCRDYKWEEIQDSLMGQKYEEVKATYQLLGYKTPKLEGHMITMKPLPLADPTTATVLSHPKINGMRKESQDHHLSTASQGGPVALPSTYNTNFPDRINCPRGVSSKGNSLHTGQLAQDQWNLPESVTSASSSGNSQVWQGATGGLLHLHRQTLVFQVGQKDQACGSEQSGAHQTSWIISRAPCTLYRA